ncbi:MAG: TfoX/Sxy family protein [Gulosibacter sp.]|uniref:TfoX/Sxy family protein n=1 Tax=Gulosibacter sp. TaxID=2817531 RepID=UPI003F9025F1
MTSEQSELIERVRALLNDEPVVREVSMFGGRSFMVNEKMIVSALKNGGLLVRVDGDQHGALLRRPGAVQAEMGKDRTMGPGWIEVQAEAIREDAELATSVGIAVDYNRMLTGH